MTNKEIKRASDDLAIMTYLLEEDYVENGGEVTEETERRERQIAALKELLTTDGIDSLGHWLRAKEDEIKNLKAERDYIARQIKAHEGTIDYIKQTANAILKKAGVEAVKGALGYKFQRYESVKSSYDAAALDEEYLDLATEAVRSAGLPSCIDVALKTNATRLSEDTALARFVTEARTDTCKFTKPRAAKEEKEA